MSEAAIQPAPEIEWPTASDPKWRREHRAFLSLLPSLLPTHRDQYVAIHEGRVVDSGDDQAAVAMRAYSRYGYVPIYVGLVTDAPGPVIRVPSPRLMTRGIDPA